MMKRRFAPAALAAALGLSLVSMLPGAASAQSGPVATVNGVAIPGSLADFMFKQQTAKGTGADPARVRQAIRDDLINREVILQEARRAGMLKRPEIGTEYELMLQSTIVRLYLREWVRAHPVTEDELRKGYEQARANAPDKEYLARHILLASASEAREAINELKNGAKFEALAQRSKDPGTRGRGGELGWAVPGAFDKDFAQSVVGLAKGQLTATPVKTRFGYHVIQLQDVRPIKLPTYEQLKPRILQQLTQRRIEAMVRDLRAQAKVE